MGRSINSNVINPFQNAFHGISPQNMQAPQMPQQPQQTMPYNNIIDTRRQLKAINQAVNF